MCRIRFEIETATKVTTAKGRYRKVGASSWSEFSVNLSNPQTPDIKEIGEYEMQIKVNNGKWQGNYPFSVKEDCGNNGGEETGTITIGEVTVNNGVDIDNLTAKQKYCKKALERELYDIKVHLREDKSEYFLNPNRQIRGASYALTSKIGKVKQFKKEADVVIYELSQAGQTDTLTLTNCYGSVTKQVQIPKGDNDNGTDNGGSTNADKPIMSFSRVICQGNEPKKYILKDWSRVGGLVFESSPSSYIKGWKPLDDIGFEYELIFVSTPPNMQGRRITFETNKRYCRSAISCIFQM